MLTFRRNTIKNSPQQTVLRATSNRSSSPMTSTAAAAPKKATSKPRPVTAEERRQMIEKEAYFIAERRGFQGGNPIQDWLEAEMKIDRHLNTMH